AVCSAGAAVECDGVERRGRGHRYRLLQFVVWRHHPDDECAIHHGRSGVEYRWVDADAGREYLYRIAVHAAAGEVHGRPVRYGPTDVDLQFHGDPSESEP